MKNDGFELLKTYNKMSALPKDRIERMQQDWEQWKQENDGYSESAAELMDLMFLLALESAEKRALA